MKREEAWKFFLENYAQKICRMKLMEVEDCFQKYRDEFVPDFLESFRQICLKTKLMQEYNGKGKVRYITYSFLRTSLMERKPVYLVEALNKEMFFDTVECSIEYYPEWLFKFIDGLERELEEKRKLYMNLIIPCDIESFILKVVGNFNMYMVKLARYSMPKAIEIPEYKEIAVDEEVEIRVGEYMDFGTTVHKEDRRVKDSNEIREWLEENNGLNYMHNVFSGLNLAGANLRGINLCCADLTYSDLSGSHMQYCTLIGTKFCRGSLQGTDLYKSWIQEADFSGCNLKGANFCEVVGHDGIRDKNKWEKPGYLPVNFSGANLEEADFTEADLRGANFKDTGLKGVKFDRANMERALFSKHDAEMLDLSDEQRSSIIWI